jgi:uncharacterized protein (DUF1499 family)
MGFQAALAGMAAGVLALVAAALAWFRTRARTGLRGRGQALAGAALGAAVLLGMLGGARAGGGAPAIHDVSTDLADPPRFSERVRNAPDRHNGVDHPDGGPRVPELQRQAFPDLQPIALSAPPAEVLARARRAAESLGWRVEAVDTEAGRLEAVAVSRIFRFVDDVVVRVRPAPGGSVVDVRSNSRFGGGDLGANAARIRAFRERLTGGPGAGEPG